MYEGRKVSKYMISNWPFISRTSYGIVSDTDCGHCDSSSSTENSLSFSFFLSLSLTHSLRYERSSSSGCRQANKNISQNVKLGSTEFREFHQEHNCWQRITPLNELHWGNLNTHLLKLQINNQLLQQIVNVELHSWQRSQKNNNTSQSHRWLTA